jgi:hypothetical protein
MTRFSVVQEGFATLTFEPMYAIMPHYMAVREY